MVKGLIASHAELMLLPWEYQRAMGIVKPANPMTVKYTFLSHQWETPGHPFPDLKQLTEHLDSITDPLFWCDWYCVPQWSRNTDPYPPDPMAITIFLTTMKSFHRLCAYSQTALAVVKRGDGLKMRGFDKQRGWQIDQEMLADAEEADALIRQVRDTARAKGSRLQLREVTAEAVGCGVDLEYGVRAWCALERCYLPAAPHKDVRLVSLAASVRKLRNHAHVLQSELSKLRESRQMPSKKEAASLDDEAEDPLSKMMNNIERLSGLIDLCQPSEANRTFYMNAWAYH